jgi:tRNA threonylcarbamoyladenosine biosynthesis protein TsaE
MTTLSATHLLADESATAALGAALGDALTAMEAQILLHGIAIGLDGELGAGKTTLVRGLLRRLGVQGVVKSPTFSLLEPYAVSRLHLYHFDFYRFNNPREFLDGGFSDFFGPGGICLLEWPKRAVPYLPQVDLDIRLQVLEDGRAVSLSAITQTGEQCLHRLDPYLRAARAAA